MGIFDFFTGGSSEKQCFYTDHIHPVVHNTGSLTYADCANWVNRRVVLLLKRFERPQLGTVKYVGIDHLGILCAGIEFDYDIGGMSGKVDGQKLFKCKSNHGLLVPAQYIKLLEDHENGTQIFPLPVNRSQLSRAHSVPNLPGNGVANVSLQEYYSEGLPGLNVGNNVVWLGGVDPCTGIVKWIGRVGQNTRSTLKSWVEMDDFVGAGLNNEDTGVHFGCAPNRGKLLPVDELILLENFIPGSDPSDTRSPIFQTGDFSLPNVEVTSRLQPSIDPVPVVTDLIDLGPTVEGASASGELSIADHFFNQILNDNPDPSSVCTGETSLLVPRSSSVIEDNSSENLVNGSNPFNNSTVYPFSNAQPHHSSWDSFLNRPSEPVTQNLSDNVSHEMVTSLHQSQKSQAKVFTPITDENKAAASPFPSPSLHSNENQLEDGTISPGEDYLPPFIVPPISIVEFFRAGGMKGIQGKRNSCYIDVVLFAMFAFTDTFDPYFLVKTSHFSKGPDSELTKVAKKILAGQIVNPLRQNYFCSATGVTFFREIMIQFSDKLDGAFMDIEEFMLIMFDKLFNLQEFVIYDNNMKDYLHQINLGDHDLPAVMTVKQCLELSMKDYGLQFQEVPSPALIIEIPRNTYGIIQSTTIVPNLKLNIGDVMNPKNSSANRALSNTMNLLAVICINNFHFVTFVKSGSGALAHWVLFDSNPSEERPKAEIVPNMGEWLESLEHRCLTNPYEIASTKHKLPPMVQKLLSDIYVCIYCPEKVI